MLNILLLHQKWDITGIYVYYITIHIHDIPVFNFNTRKSNIISKPPKIGLSSDITNIWHISVFGIEIGLSSDWRKIKVSGQLTKKYLSLIYK